MLDLTASPRSVVIDSPISGLLRPTAYVSKSLHSSEAKKRSSAATMMSWFVIRLEALNPLSRS